MKQQEIRRQGEKKLSGAGTPGSAAGWGRLVLILAFFAFGLLLSLSVRWMTSNWAELTMEEFLFQMSTLTGTGGAMVKGYLKGSVVPCVIITSAVCIGYFALKNAAVRRRFAQAVLAAGAVLLTAGLAAGARFIHIGTWLGSLGKESDLVGSSYVDPADVRITFPEKKRNLVYLYLESMEITYASLEDGGFNEVSRIPELTALAYEKGNESFSGSSGRLNGAISAYGSGWTMAAIFAQTSGLPLKISINGNKMDSQESFFPGVTALGDILEKEGYRQAFLIGSDAEFGGRALYMENHGGYELWDYHWALETGNIPENYNVFWGYEDEKLFEIAKKTLSELSEGDEPFNLTMLTVDTHHPDGYHCELCGDSFDGQYDNAIACTDRQAAEFIRWLKEQPFYENTTVVIAGDHPSMKSGYMSEVAKKDRKVYTLILNGAAVNEKPDQYREYTTMDLFPTTLAAIGADIGGDMLGLGVNLYSGHSTLAERYSLSEINEQLTRPSDILDGLMKIDTTSEKYIRFIAEYGEAAVYAYPLEDGKYLLRAENAASMTGNTGKTVEVLATAADKEGNETSWELVLAGGGTYQGIVSFPESASGDGWSKDCRLKVVSRTDKGYERILYDGMYRPELETDSGFADYLAGLAAEEDIAVFLSIRDEGTNGLTDGMQEMLHALGLQETLKGNFRTDYCAVIDRGSVLLEKMSGDSIAETGALSDGTTWRIESSRDDNDTNTVSSILVDGVEYSKNRQGINAVVYSYDSGSVIQSRNYNTYRDWPYAWVTVNGEKYGGDGTVEIVMEDNDSGAATVTGWIWNEEQPDLNMYLSLENTEHTPYWKTQADAGALIGNTGGAIRVELYGADNEADYVIHLCGTSWEPE